MNNLNKNFWDTYYKNNTDDIKKPSSFSEFVYSKYLKNYNDNKVYLKICDLGSGNCRDTVFFYSKGNMSIGVDINGVLDKEFNNCKLLKKDVLQYLVNKPLNTLFDIIYIRWFLHALPYDISRKIFINSVRNLKPNGLICIEVRSINDEELKKSSTYDEKDKSYTTKHKRWLYSMDMIKELASQNDCEVLFSKEGYFSPNKNTETHNPLLIRFICKKKLLPYYEKSENFKFYKHILPKMKNNTLKTYDDMNKLNNILEKNNIKYVAVAGSILGLQRHGGIIPWDNDIDIGFIEPEWNKLFTIKHVIEKNGLKYNKESNNHCHFGTIDCFKLTLDKKDNTLKGDAKTLCSLVEYNNVKKQIFGYTYLYAPFNSHNSLKNRYGDYFNDGNVNDNFHFKDNSVKIFKLNHYDLSYQLK